MTPFELQTRLVPFLQLFDRRLKRVPPARMPRWHAMVTLSEVSGIEVIETVPLLEAFLEHGLLVGDWTGVELSLLSHELLNSGPAAVADLGQKAVLSKMAEDKRLLKGVVSVSPNPAVAHVQDPEVAESKPPGALLWVVVVGIVLAAAALLSKDRVERPNPFSPDVSRRTKEAISRALERADLEAEKNGYRLTDEQVEDIISREGAKQYRHQGTP